MSHSIYRPFYLEGAEQEVRKPAPAPVREGSRSPWGTIDYVEQLAEGIYRVSTPRHGGLKLDRARNAKMPRIFRRKGGWFEEDCEWALVYTIFHEALELNEKEYQEAKRTVGWWFPDEYEAYFGEILKPGESWIKDKRLHFEAHAEDWLVTCAWGDWHAQVPSGKVGVKAVQGKDHDPEYGTCRVGVVARYFLVDEGRYDSGNHLPYVVGPEDKECPPIN